MLDSIDHVNLVVLDLDRMTAFYSKRSPRIWFVRETSRFLLTNRGGDGAGAQEDLERVEARQAKTAFAKLRHIPAGRDTESA